MTRPVFRSKDGQAKAGRTGDHRCVRCGSRPRGAAADRRSAGGDPGVGVILHFGARKNAISKTGVAIADPQALLQWLGKDRAAVTFRDAAELAKQRAAFIALLREWIQHLPV
jgi:hypothetical protein